MALGQGSDEGIIRGTGATHRKPRCTPGRILIRRSPLLDVRTLDRAGMTRTDIPQDLTKQIGAENVASPLSVQPFEAYRFDRNPAASIRLAAEPIEAKITANVQSIFKITDANRTLESRIVFAVKDRAGVSAANVFARRFPPRSSFLPGDFEYAITAKNERRLLTIFLTSGRLGDFEVLLQGTLGKQTGLDKVPVAALGGARRRTASKAISPCRPATPTTSRPST